MNRLWAKFLPQMEQRVATLTAAAAGLQHGTLSPEERQNACADAHKLAGVLGTFGLQQGTELAREAEDLYSTMATSDKAASSRLTEIADQLRTMIAARLWRETETPRQSSY